MLKYLRVLYVQVLIAIMIGIFAGAFLSADGGRMQPLGKMFINLIKMIIAPLIFHSCDRHRGHERHQGRG